MRTKFDDLTREQVVNLSEEDISYYKEYAMAENGMVLPPHPGEKPENVKLPEPTEIAYTCRGIVVTDMEEAKILATLSSVVYEHYDYDYGSNNKWLQEKEMYGNDSSGIKKEKYYKKEDIARYRDEIKKVKKLQSDWSEDMDRYNEASKGIEVIVEHITYILQSVSTENWFIEQAKNKYSSLRELTEENDQISYNFFLKAFPIESTEEKLNGFYAVHETSAIQPLNYDQFLDRVGVKHDK